MPAKKRIRRARKRKWLRPPLHGAPPALERRTTERTEGTRPLSEYQAETVKATTDFGERYAYVLSDLKRSGALAGMLLFVLIILSRILR